jgi:2-polyprenyl-3-methyl-5-hydroxy-6-metoxy-1,4-benzoquinol methylase
MKDSASASAVYGTRDWLDEEYQRVGSDPWGLEWRPSQSERYHQMIDVLGAALRARPAAPRAVLDVGCATGAFTALLARALSGSATEVRGIDMAELAVARARVRHPTLTFDCLTLEEASARLPWPFDLVTMLEVIYYVPEVARAAALRRVRALLKPGGVVLVSSMTAQEPYMSAAQLGELVGASFAVVDSGVLHLKPLAMLEKPLLRLMPLVERWRGGGARAAEPARPRAAQALAQLARRALGARAVSHSYVVAVREEDGRP